MTPSRLALACEVFLDRVNRASGSRVVEQEESGHRQHLGTWNRHEEAWVGGGAHKQAVLASEKTLEIGGQAPRLIFVESDLTSQNYSLLRTVGGILIESPMK